MRSGVAGSILCGDDMTSASTSTTDSNDAAKALAEWREQRLAALTAEDGWLNLVGLWWLDDGPISVGADPASDAVLPRGPSRLGTAKLTGDAFRFEPGDALMERVSLTVPEKGPVRFSAGGFLMEAVRLTGRTALRIRDPDSPARRNFAGVDTFPFDPAWRIVADWVALETPIHTEVDTVIGAPTAVTITHKARFEHEGRSFELLPTFGTPQAPQFVIRDQTAGKETYPASRFLFGEELSDTTIVLDFNRAINPPCAFSTFAICPLPPPGNVLPFRIEAGEKNWHG